jgi:O-antigen ligase
MSSLKKIQEYFLYLFIFLLPWQTRWIVRDAQISGGIFEYGRISIYSFDIIFLFLLLNYLIVKLLNNHPEPTAVGSPLLRKEGITASLSSPFEGEVVRPRRTRGVVVFCFLLIVFCFLNIFTSSDKLLSAYWYLRLTEGLILIYLIKKINFSQTKAALAFIFSVTISAGLGIYQFFTQSVFVSKWLGMASQHPGDLGVSVVETTGGRFLRAYGNLPHPNILAGFLIIAIILCFYLIIKNHNPENKNRKLKILLITYYLLLITGLFFTFSRAAWLVLALFFITLLLYCFIKKKSASLLLITYYLLPLLLLISCLSFIYWPLIQTRTSASSRLELKSNTERLTGYSEAWQIIKQNPLIGVGLGNYTVALQKNIPHQPAWFYQPVHNVYLLALSELGFFIFLPFFLFLLFFFFTHRRFVLMFICFNVFLFSDHFFWTLPSGLLLIFIITSLFTKNICHSDRPAEEAGSGGIPSPI